MRKNIFIIFLISTLLISNGYWLFKNHRTINRENYNETLRCELGKLSYCNKTFPLGITLNRFKTIANKEKLIFSALKDRENGDKLCTILDVFSGCPISGRPYCGFDFIFKNGKLKEIVAGYPCH